MVTCTICHRDLPDSEFYPSNLKRHQYQCKKCHSEKCKNYNKEVAQLEIGNFDHFYGGLNVKILNFVRPNEYRFIIESTAGKTFQTNDASEFMEKLWEELKQRT